MRRVWHSRWLDAAAALGRDMRFALRSLLRAKGLAATVVVTLALGIGANAAIFSVVRGVLLRPLVNRDEDRLIYIRQSAPGLGAENTTFSVPEINDFKSRVTTISAFGDFSTVDFTMIGLGGEPRMVKAGVVSGSFFDVMGLRPVLGRLLNAHDDGPKAAGAAVLTYRFWTTSLNSDPTVIGKTIRLGPRTATVVGVLEPSVPYPADTEIIANVVTSPHHLGATMVTEPHAPDDGALRPPRARRLARGGARRADRGARRHDARAPRGVFGEGRRPAERHAAARSDRGAGADDPARAARRRRGRVRHRVLERRQPDPGALGAPRGRAGRARRARRRPRRAPADAARREPGALRRRRRARRAAGAAARRDGRRYAARFSVRALDVTVDASVLWVGAGLAMAAAVLLAYVPRLPSPHAPAGLGLASGSVRITPGTNRRLRVFATTQIAFSFVLLAGAGMLLATLVALQTANTGYDMRQVLAFDIPTSATGVGGAKVIDFYQEATRRIGELPGVEGVAVGSFVPWRDAGSFGPGFQFTVEGYTPADGEENPHARLRIVAPRFFAVLGVPLLAGRDFTDDDRAGSEPVAIVSQSVAQRLFPNGDAVNRHMWWTDPVLRQARAPPHRRRRRGRGRRERRAGPGADGLSPGPADGRLAGRLFVHAAGDPYALVPAVTRVIREISADQPVERAATLEDVRAEVLSPERLNAFVFSGFAGIALLIAVVGVAGVLAFSVSARTREFGVRLAVGSSPRHLLARVLSEGALIAAIGIVAGAAGGYALARVAARFVENVQLPGALPVAGRRGRARSAPPSSRR